MKKFLLGCCVGVLLTIFVDKVFLNGEMSAYDFIIAIIDKPFIQTHGICILAGIGVCFFAYRMTESLTQRFTDISQRILQENTKILGKIIKAINK